MDEWVEQPKVVMLRNSETCKQIMLCVIGNWKTVVHTNIPGSSQECWFRNSFLFPFESSSTPWALRFFLKEEILDFGILLRRFDTKLKWIVWVWWNFFLLWTMYVISLAVIKFTSHQSREWPFIFRVMYCNGVGSAVSRIAFHFQEHVSEILCC